MGEFGLAVFWRKTMGKGCYGGMKGHFFPQPTDTPNIFVHVINQPLNMSAPLMGNRIIMGNNKPLRAQFLQGNLMDSLEINILWKAVRKWSLK